MRRDKGLLLDMKRALLLILQFAEQMSFDVFRTDLKTQSAVIHQFLLIGENSTDTCLRCHAGGVGNTWGDDVLNPGPLYGGATCFSPATTPVTT